MATTPMNRPDRPSESNSDEPLLPEPVRPESWECCGSDCGDACIQTLYWQEKAAYDAQQKRLNARSDSLENPDAV
ncbi:hypothetical protein [Neisseria sp.]|uniref:hypothetical protein n=1 Tax=Neisseria sp. TaxID=192066 RepID=UPI0035A1B737